MNNNFYLYSSQGELIGEYKSKIKLMKEYNSIVKFNSFLFSYSLLVEIKPNHFKIKVFY
ncbi:MAG: hypothetical protein IKG27_05710 [Bacilli bacterium]|nr:hypothetical protein [Bacilli bacterium]